MQDDNYTEWQIEAVLNECGVEIVSDIATHFLCFCPYHGNNRTPSFEIDKISGLFLCFNPACDARGKLLDLVRATTHKTEFAARRLIIKCAKADSQEFVTRLAARFEENPDFVPFDQTTLDRLYEEFWKYSKSIRYMMGRGFTEETLRHFRIGYSSKHDMVTVPMHDPKGMPIGLIGRSIEDKIFKNSRQLPKNKTIWNLHRAKAAGGTIVLTEASFDSMLVHQDGFACTGALLGGSLSVYHEYLLNKYFSTIIIATDWDDKSLAENKYPGCRRCQGECQGHNPGRQLGLSIADKLSHKRVLWAVYEDGVVYPDGAKDLGKLDHEARVQVVRNAVPTIEYLSWGLDN